MAAPGVIEFKDRSGRVVGRVGPNFYSPLEFAMRAYHATQWRKTNLVICVAVAREESWFSPDAEGDLLRVGEKTADGRTWGPSVGVLQIRTIKEDTGKGTGYDIKALSKSTTAVLEQAYKMWLERERLKGVGKGWTHWGAFNSGAYKQHIPMAERVVATIMGTT